MNGPEIKLEDIPRLTQQGDEQPLYWIAKNLGIDVAVAICRKFSSQTPQILSWRTIAANANDREMTVRPSSQ